MSYLEEPMTPGTGRRMPAPREYWRFKWRENLEWPLATCGCGSVEKRRELCEKLDGQVCLVVSYEGIDVCPSFQHILPRLSGLISVRIPGVLFILGVPDTCLEPLDWVAPTGRREYRR